MTGSLNPKQLELLLDARENAERLLKTSTSAGAGAPEQGRDELTLRPEAPANLLRSPLMPRRRGRRPSTSRSASTLLRIFRGVGRRPPARSGAEQPHRQCSPPIPMPAPHHASAARDGEETVRLSVADTESGIPPEHLPHVFEKFFRIPDQSRAGGTGLGLSIVREIVAAHHGDITCASTLGHGTTFHVRLPVWREQP